MFWRRSPLSDFLSEHSRSAPTWRGICRTPAYVGTGSGRPYFGTVEPHELTQFLCSPVVGLILGRAHGLFL
jgi:hypothetical protein